MKFEDLDSRMRALERFHSIKIPAGVFPIIRVDGRSFSRLTEQRFEKPFDERFHQAMLLAAETLLAELQGFYAYTESDEISIACPASSDFFDRELEKIVSVTAAIASATFSLAIGAPVAFDSRICAAQDELEVVDYFRWRQADAGRCALNGCCYWMLRKSGKSARSATRLLEAQDVGTKKELLRKSGIDFDGLPAWKRLGNGLYWETLEKVGYNPKKKIQETALRRRIRIDEDLPTGPAYDKLLRSLLPREDDT